MTEPAMTANPPRPCDAAPLEVRLASPRGFCAGVERAIRTVEDALAHFGPPVYVRHEIVHNAHVVNRLRAMGAVFVDELADAPDDRPVVLSAHGVARSVYVEGAARNLTLVDATCPLVHKVHNQIRRNVDRGVHTVLIGHAGHPEVVGALGHAPAGAISLVETAGAVAALDLPDGPLAYVTQTTLSVDETATTIAALRARFPRIVGPRTDDICYATSNRQAAVKATAAGTDLYLVVGDPTSSNSRRLVETAKAAGARAARLVPDPDAFDLAALDGVVRIGVSSGASAPESLVETLLARLAETRRLIVETVDVAEETVAFRPPALRAG